MRATGREQREKGTDHDRAGAMVDVESLLKHVGASLEPISGARVRVQLNHMEEVLHRPHHSNVIDTLSLTHLRAFLARAGVTPSLYEARKAE